MTNVQERAAAGALGLASALPQFSASMPGPARAGAMLRGGDSIRRTGPQFGPSLGSPVQNAGPLSGIIAQLLGIVQQLLSQFRAGGGESYFQTATASSTGDPHLAFSGTGGDGSSVQSHFDSMSAHGDLLHSNSFAGGYRISTSVTAAAANGVTYNRAATVSTNFGATQVSLDRDGRASVTQGGQTVALADGQSVQVGNGESVTRNADGSLVIYDENEMGAQITTTLSENGSGVDVNVRAANVDLAGDLLSQPQQLTAPVLPLETPQEQL